MQQDKERLTIVVGDEEHLENTEHSSSEVKENAFNAPTNGALALEVHVNLDRGRTHTNIAIVLVREHTKNELYWSLDMVKVDKG